MYAHSISELETAFRRNVDGISTSGASFSPLAYSLDVILPLVDLQQEKDWAPMIPTPKAVWWEELRSTGWKHGARLVLWAETLFGWLVSLLLVAIVSGLIKRRED